MQTQSAIAIPKTLPSPKFSFLQQVVFRHPNGKLSRPILITGLEYVSFADAMARRLESHGWLYTVNLLYAMSEVEILAINEDGRTVDQLWEDELAVVEDSTNA